MKYFKKTSQEWRTYIFFFIERTQVLHHNGWKRTHIKAHCCKISGAWGQEAYTFLERLEDMTSYPRNSKRKLFPNQILYPGKVRGDKKSPIGTPDLKQLKSLRSFSGSPWSLCSTTWRRGSRLWERMTGGTGTRRASQGERAKGILKVTVTRDPRMSESQAETGENSNICGQAQSGLHSHNHRSSEMNRRAQWKSEEPLLPQGDTKWGVTKSVPHVNGRAKVGPLVKTLLTADPIAQRKHEGPILLYLHIHPCVSRQCPERRAKGTFPLVWSVHIKHVSLDCTKCIGKNGTG